MKRLLLVAASAAVAVAAPATAKPQHPSHPSTSKKCMAHKVAYIASGDLVSWSATANADGTYSGTITVHVTKANKHSKADKGNDVTYTLTDAKVRFSHGGNPPAAGDPVKVIGKVTALAKKCDQTGFTPTVTAHRVVVHGPAHS